MTVRDDFESKRKGFGAGIADYLVKPIDLDELLLRMEALLRRAKLPTTKRLGGYKKSKGQPWVAFKKLLTGLWIIS